ncbi:MAG: hypothetical protein ABJH07_11465 [Sedimentitalea sp.]|uniref:hypothetical protein n=1 Tax=Sedimentitalea sp. TaxID=2048915 RepID=UPI003299F934
MKHLSNYLGRVTKMVTRPTTALAGFLGIMLAFTDAVSLATSALLKREQQIEGVTLIRTEEQPKGKQFAIAGAYLDLELLLINWPKEGVALSSASRALAENYEYITSHEANQYIDIGGLAGIAHKAFPLPAASTQGVVEKDFSAILCIAQEANKAVNYWNGVVYSVLRERGEWTSLEGAELDEFSLFPEGESLSRAVQIGNRVTRVQLTAARLVTLDRFVAFGENPCDEKRLAAY